MYMNYLLPSTQTHKIHVPMCHMLLSRITETELFELGRTFEGHSVPPSCNEQLQPEQAAQSLIQLEPGCSQAWTFHHPDCKNIFPCIYSEIYICIYWISQLVKYVCTYFFLM